MAGSAGGWASITVICTTPNTCPEQTYLVSYQDLGEVSDEVRRWCGRQPIFVTNDGRQVRAGRRFGYPGVRAACAAPRLRVQKAPQRIPIWNGHRSVKCPGRSAAAPAQETNGPLTNVRTLAILQANGIEGQRPGQAYRPIRRKKYVALFPLSRYAFNEPSEGCDLMRLMAGLLRMKGQPLIQLG